VKKSPQQLPGFQEFPSRAYGGGLGITLKRVADVSVRKERAAHNMNCVVKSYSANWEEQLWGVMEFA
jgi:hypothetical protein